MKGKPIEPGCLALIVGAKHCTENLGRVVRVLRKPEPMERLDHRPKTTPWDTGSWIVEPLPGHPDLLAAVVENLPSPALQGANPLARCESVHPHPNR